MADIHGMNDFSNNNNGRNRPNQGNQQAQGNQGNMMFFGSGNNFNNDPRKETFLEFLTNIFCPYATWKSVSIYIIFINIIIYFITLFFGLSTRPIDLINFLPVDPKTLRLFSLSPSEMKLNGIQFYRWVTNSLLHADFVHMIYNSIGILIFGTFLEKLIGSLKFVSIYVVSGILGSLFSGLIQPSSSSVGASISLYGILGGYFAFCFVKWKSLDRILGPLGKCFTFYFLIIYILISFLFQSNQEFINLYGHLGGLIMGFFFTPIIYKPETEEESLWCKYSFWNYISIGVIGIFAISGFLCFYLIIN